MSQSTSTAQLSACVDHAKSAVSLQRSKLLEAENQQEQLKLVVANEKKILDSLIRTETRIIQELAAKEQRLVEKRRRKDQRKEIKKLHQRRNNLKRMMGKTTKSLQRLEDEKSKLENKTRADHLALQRVTTEISTKTTTLKHNIRASRPQKRNQPDFPRNNVSKGLHSDEKKGSWQNVGGRNASKRDNISYDEVLVIETGTGAGNMILHPYGLLWLITRFELC
jgi:predicted  nucleic acid-binding Zn-ribbon protein